MIEYSQGLVKERHSIFVGYFHYNTMLDNSINDYNEIIKENQVFQKNITHRIRKKIAQHVPNLALFFIL